MPDQTMPAEGADLETCEAFLQSPAYAALTDAEQEAFRARYMAAAAAARRLAGRASRPA